LRAPLTGLAVLLLAGCTVRLRPEFQVPQPLMQPMSAQVGLVLDEPLRTYFHEETRSGGEWKIDLGTGHDKLFRSVFGASFQPLQVFGDLDGARAASGLQVIFEPRIEQFSFVTALETSGHWAVTIRYRIAVLDPAGTPVDSFTLTGYGSALGERSTEASLTVATRAAMRDAASKFLVQMPRQALAQKLMAGQPVSVADRAVVSVDVVEVVPIDPSGG
jgi:hypothetical protein